MSVEIGKVDLEHRYDPWIGESYRKRLAAYTKQESIEAILWRCHVMAESHYSLEDDFAGMTVSAVRQLALERNEFGRFWTLIACSVSGVPGDQIDREAVWNDIAFSNFVQTLLSDHGIAPTDDQWGDARRRFFSQLVLTRPTILAVFSHRAFENLPNEGVKCPPMQMRPDWPVVDDAWLYPYQVEEGVDVTIAVKNKHPRGGLSPTLAYQRIATVASFYSNLAIRYHEGAFEQ